MQKFEKGFFVGAATAAHQVEGNNIHSDYWAQEQLPHTSFTEPSGIACDHYNKYEEDIKLLVDAGLNAYRFSIEWARIEPEEGKFDPAEIEHYRKVMALLPVLRFLPMGFRRSMRSVRRFFATAPESSGSCWNTVRQL